MHEKRERAEIGLVVSYGYRVFHGKKINVAHILRHFPILAIPDEKFMSSGGSLLQENQFFPADIGTGRLRLEGSYEFVLLYHLNAN